MAEADRKHVLRHRFKGAPTPTFGRGYRLQDDPRRMEKDKDVWQSMALQTGGFWHVSFSIQHFKRRQASSPCFSHISPCGQGPPLCDWRNKPLDGRLQANAECGGLADQFAAWQGQREARQVVRNISPGV